MASNQEAPKKFTATLFIISIFLLLSFVFGSAARPSKKLTHPVVILISSDGFRFGYQFKTPTPNINRLIKGGTEAKTGLIPVFPSETYPNHYSIATGLYPAHHGVVSNHFYAPDTGKYFDTGNTDANDPSWWLGEPLWETVTRVGKLATAYFWPGSEVIKENWKCPPKYCEPYDESVPFEDRVDKVLEYFSDDQVPDFITLYFHYPDYQGHRFGPDHPNITEAVAYVDRMIGRLIQGLEKIGVFDDVNIILVSDHGMVGTTDLKVIYVQDIVLEGVADDLKTIQPTWIDTGGKASWGLSIRPPNKLEAADVVAKMNRALSSGKVTNGRYLKMYLKEKLPERLHWSEETNGRIAPIVGLVGEGYLVKHNSSSPGHFGGSHGFDNQLFSMRAIFVGHGPRFPKGKKLEPFKNVEIYNLVTSILNIKGAPNNGTPGFTERVLLPVPAAPSSLEKLPPLFLE